MAFPVTFVPVKSTLLVLISVILMVALKVICGEVLSHNYRTEGVCVFCVSADTHSCRGILLRDVASPPLVMRNIYYLPSPIQSLPRIRLSKPNKLALRIECGC